VTPRVEVSETKDREEQEEVIMATVKDVVCGMEIDPKDAAATETYQGKKYYFCAKMCAQKFKADPKKYVGKA
jgi:Cu+-exporting ATPase